MAFSRGASRFGKPALRFLVPIYEGAATSSPAGISESLQVAALRSEGASSGTTRLFSTSRAFQQQAATGGMQEAADQAKASPGKLYAAIGGAAGAAAGIYYLLFGGSSKDDSAVAQVGISAGHIGPYDVQTHTGSSFTHNELQDTFAIVYFGSTTATDCVSELEKLGEVVQQSDRKSNMHYLAPLFVTIDPQTDTEEKMKNVVELFNGNHNRRNVRLVGLTGPDTVKLHQAAEEYTGKSSPSPDQPDTRFYLVDPKGHFVKAYPASATVKDISDEMADIFQSYSVNNPSWHAPKKVARRHA